MSADDPAGPPSRRSAIRPSTIGHRPIGHPAIDHPATGIPVADDPTTDASAADDLAALLRGPTAMPTRSSGEGAEHIGAALDAVGGTATV